MRNLSKGSRAAAATAAPPRSLHVAAAPAGGSPLSLVAVRRRVCVVVPTRNEVGNVGPLLDRLGPVLSALDGEVLFVDDSSDDTPAAVLAAAAAAPVPVRLLHRAPGERVGGLGGAVQAGLRAVDAEWVVVMDGDLQHPPEVVSSILARAERGDVDVVIASRYCGDGSSEGLSSRFRGVVSSGATGAAKLLFPRALAAVTDPMSGFFAVRAAALDVEALQPRGFKILLEMLARTPGLRVAEVAFTFAERHAGHSNASAREAVRYLRQLAALRLSTADRLGRLARFAAVGASGIGVNLLALALLLMAHLGSRIVGGDALSAVIATQLAVAWNFTLTERWVFSGHRGHWLRRLGPFWVLSCAALLAQLPLAATLQPLVGGSYLLATGAALGILVLTRFTVCDLWLYGRRVTGSHRAQSVLAKAS